MDAFTVYKTYLGIKSHFKSPSYDYTKYGNVKAKPETYISRKDRSFFERISKKYRDDEIVNLFVANFLNNENVWIGDFLTTEMEDVYQDWCRRRESIEYLFEQDVNRICDHLENHNMKFDDLFDCKQSHPQIFKFVMQKEITPETYVILDQLLEFNNDFDKKLRNDPAYNNMICKFKKYRSFLDVTGKRKHYKKILVDTVNMYALA